MENEMDRRENIARDNVETTEAPAGGPPLGGPPAGGPPAGGPPLGEPPLGGPPAGGGPNSFGNQPPGHDPVTGVFNMAAFGQEFVKLLAEGVRENTALWYIDVRTFRSINPKFGFLTGNQVLADIADNIRNLLAHNNMITRLGGDRFVLVSTGLDFDAANKAFHALVEQVNTDIVNFGIHNRLTFMGGVYYLRTADFERRDFRRPLDYASIAHRKAQAGAHSTLTLFTDEDLERDTRRIIIEQSIDHALESGQIEVWYQPQIDYVYGEVIGAEALARWKHPELGWIGPAEFIPVLENCGKVHDLDLYIWEEACRSAGRWRAVADGKPVPISVNVSRTEMFEPGLLEHFKELQRKYGLPNGSLHLEVTESAFVEEAERLYSIIETMRDNDMIVEMDDFGSGLSSLNMLKDVPVDVVKLDMGFVRSGVNGDRGGVILGSVIRMLQGLDTPIIAEGVETLEQAELLKNLGCHLMQGYHFSKPMPLEEFESFIESNSTLERTERRKRLNSHLEDLVDLDVASSYLFNEVMGATMFFFVSGRSSESILVNDQFYEACGLNRAVFGNQKVNPIQEIDPESRETLWRAAAEAREYGSATCIAQVRLTKRWFEGCIRYLEESNRGLVYSLNILRSGEHVERMHEREGALRDAEWRLDLLSKVVPYGFAKCQLDEGLAVEYASDKLMENLGLTIEEFTRRFHNSFIELVSATDRATVFEAAQKSNTEGHPVDCKAHLYCGWGALMKAEIMGRVETDVSGRRLLYLFVILRGEVENDEQGEADVLFSRIVPFDYYLSDDLLVIHNPMPDGSTHDIEIENWLHKLDSLPDNIDPTSAAKVLATVRDLRHHPLSGFTDLKCNLRGGTHLRWYHINYSCEADQDGNTAVLHGFAQDANDEMGSAKWWRRQAEICHLTGLLNRNAVEQKINLLMRTNGGGMMFMIDLDDFKRVNDELGHLSGDNLLREVAETLSEHFRETDALGRYGGDEFVAFMPTPPTGDPVDLALRRAGSIIEAIRRIKIPDGTYAACSVGVAICTQRDASFYDLLEVADQALYESKAAGKKTVTIRRM